MCFAVKTLRNLRQTLQRKLRIDAAPETERNCVGQIEVEAREKQVVGRKQWAHRIDPISASPCPAPSGVTRGCESFARFSTPVGTAVSVASLCMSNRPAGNGHRNLEG